MDLAKLYLNKVFGITPGSWGNAHCYYDYYESISALKNNFERIANTASFIPQKGDIAVWNTNQGNGAGHIAIATGEGTTSYFYSYDQNWSKKAMTKVKHTYTNFSGVLRAYDQSKITGVSNIDFFDAELYNNIYEDLQKAFGGNETSLRQHYNDYGKKEGRIATYVFDPMYYLDKYEDLKKAFGTDYESAYNHLITYGVKEGRQTSIMFDPQYYLNKYEDLQKAFGTNYESAFEHFLTYGMSEGRQASADFNVEKYKSNYSDLQKAFGSNYKEYFKHWYCFGKNEGRTCA